MKLLDPRQRRAELVADTQGVAALCDGHDEVVAVLAEAHVVDVDIATEIDMVVVEPLPRFLDIDHRVVAVTDIKAVAIAVTRADQQVIASAAVDGLGEVRAPERIGAIGADEVDVFGVQVGVRHQLVGKAQVLDRIRLVAEAVVLVLQRDPLAAALDGESQVFLEARDLDIGEVDALQIERVAAGREQRIARAVEDGVGAITAREDVGVAVDAAFEAVVAGAAV